MAKTPKRQPSASPARPPPTPAVEAVKASKLTSLKVPRPAPNPTAPRLPLAPTNRTEVYRRRVERAAPSRFRIYSNITGAVLTAVTAGYMLIYADYGEREHVFSPVRKLLEGVGLIEDGLQRKRGEEGIPA